jgi:hypothetical protein
MRPFPEVSSDILQRVRPFKVLRAKISAIPSEAVSVFTVLQFLGALLRHARTQENIDDAI